MQRSWLKLIGPPAFHGTQGEVRFASERPFQLMALLAHRGDWVPRERLAALFWPDHAADGARRNLRKVLYRLRELAQLPLPEEAVGALRWSVETDIHRLQHAIQQQDFGAVAAAGDELAFDGIEGSGGFAQWVIFERQALRERCRAALLAGAATAADPTQALSWIEALCVRDPLDEEALRQRLGLLLRLDRVADARRLYADFESALARELAARPDAATLELSSRLNGPRRAAPPLPNHTSSALIGRRAELHTIRQRLAQPGLRWLTVLGPGGIGKTRLAQAVASERDDAVWVPLLEVAQVEQVPARLALALGLGPAARSWTGLAHALAGQQRLLVLDNVEQLTPLGEAMAPVLAAAPALTVLATSRRVLGMAGEQVFELGGLPYPDAEDQARAADFDAVRLFEQAARRHRDDFALHSQAGAVAELCRWAEGWPLALELCAAWTPRLQVDEILRELKQGRHDLLASPRGDADGRHASLHLVMQQSWLALNDRQRQALARLSVLDDPARSAVAGAVADAPLPLLATLADAAWVRRETAGLWSLHPLVGAFLRERLADQPGWQGAAVEALCNMLAQRAERAQPAWPGQTASPGTLELVTDLPALKQAWMAGVRAGRADRLDLMQGVLGTLLARQSAWDEGAALLALAEPCLQGQAAARLQATLAYLKLQGGHAQVAVELARASLRVLRRGTDRRAVLLATFVVGQGLMRLAQFSPARHLLAQARKLAQALGDVVAETQALDGVSGVAYGLGRHDEQMAILQEAIALALRHDLKPVVPLSNLGNALRATGRVDEALASFERALALAAGDPGLRRERAIARLNMGLLLGDRAGPGDHARALEAATQGLQDAAHGVDPRIELHLLGLRAALLLEQGHGEQARMHWLHALAGARRLSLVHAQQWLLLDWGRWLHRANQTDRAFYVLGCVAAQPDLPAADRASLARLRVEWGATVTGPDPREAAGAQRSLASLVDEVIAQG